MQFFDKEILWGFAKVIIFLLVATPLIYYITRFYGSKQLAHHSVIIKEKVSLGSNKMLYVVDWEGDRLLLGVTPHHISFLQKKEKSSLSNKLDVKKKGEE